MCLTNLTRMTSSVRQLLHVTRVSMGVASSATATTTAAGTPTTTATQLTTTANPPPASVLTLHRFRPVDAKWRKVPEGWIFPKCNLEKAFGYWHCGGRAIHIAPFNSFKTDDVRNRPRGPKMLFELGVSYDKTGQRSSTVGIVPTRYSSFESRRNQGCLSAVPWNHGIQMRRTAMQDVGSIELDIIIRSKPHEVKRREVK
jgi:hypothetical protein